MKQHRYGGRHSDDKVNRIRKYLAAYSQALKNKGFHLAYVDAFAGTGVRTQTIPAAPLFGDTDVQDLTIEGSARMALSIEPQLHELVFIENDSTRAEALFEIQRQNPNRNIQVHNDDANVVLQELCATTRWRGAGSVGKGIRACMFLDPYGMSVDWETLEAISKTKAIDVWYLFPLAGLFRQLARDPAKVDETKASAITKMMGTTEWRKALYSKSSATGQLGFSFDPDGEMRSADVAGIENWVQKRLETIFPCVLLPYRIHIKSAPMFSLFCAISNPRAIDLAKPIAAHILNAGKSSQTRPR